MTSSRSARRHAMVGPPRLWKKKRQFQIDYLLEQGLRPEHRVMDLGCGTLRGGIPIIDHVEAGNYYGIEVRSEVIAEAHREIRKSGLAHKAASLVIARNLGLLRLGVEFQYIWSFSVLIHMDDDEVAAAFDCVYANLGENGVFLANVNIGAARPGKDWQGFPIVWRSEEDYGKLADERDLTMERLGTLGRLGHRTGTQQDEQVMLRFARKPSVG